MLYFQKNSPPESAQPFDYSNMPKTNQHSPLSLDPRQLSRIERLFSLGTLVPGIMHEINNPLNAVLMNAELGLLLLEQNGDRDSLTKILRTIAQEAKRGGAITRSVSEFARAGSYFPNAYGDLNEAIGQARSLAGSLSHSFNVTLELQLDTTLPRFSINETAITHAVAQLIANAVQAGASSIHISTEAGADKATLKVIDNGSGIPPQAMEYIFDPFFTTWQDQGRLGLGLSLVRHIIAGHHGTLSVQGQPEGGTCFIIQLPLNET